MLEELLCDYVSLVENRIHGPVSPMLHQCLMLGCRAGLKNGNPGTRLSLSQSVQAARKVFMETSIEEDDIECMASSLIDQVSIKPKSYLTRRI